MPNKALHRIPHTVMLFAETRKKSCQYAPPVNAALEESRGQILKVFPVLIFTLFCVFGCSIFPKFEYEKAQSNIPLVIEYAKKEINLSQELKTIIDQKKPLISHANYVVYYYRWQNESGEVIITVETGSPKNGFIPHKAYLSNGT